MMLPTKILPSTFLNSMKRRRPIYQLGRVARFALGSTLGARRIDGLDRRVHYNDFMLKGGDPASVASYRRGALEFVGILGRALAEAGRDWASVESCLEIGCGYGRIVRELRRVLPVSAISVCDAIGEAAAFTAAEFDGRQIPLIEQAGAEYDGAFDLVYLLSVYTHLRGDLIEANLARVEAVTRRGGVVVFTTHGPDSASHAEAYEQYWLDKSRLLETLERTGLYYERYPYYYDEYGLTWLTRPVVEAMVARAAPSLRLLSHESAGLDGHQDVYVYRKT